LLWKNNSTATKNKFMKKCILSGLCIVLVTVSFAQSYQPNWESLDSRPVPQWFKDSKFGKFIPSGGFVFPGLMKKS